MSYYVPVPLKKRKNNQILHITIISFIFSIFFLSIYFLVISSNDFFYNEEERYPAPRLVCYYNIPNFNGSLQVSNIDPNLCTHINVAFFNIENNTLKMDEKGLRVVEELNQLKKINKNLKILLSVGGAGNRDFPGMVSNHTNRKANVDFVNIMTYDYHFFSNTTPFTALNSPLYPSLSDKGIFEVFNINYTAWYWVEKGMDKKKINIGLPTYGHSFQLLNVNNNGLYAPVKNYGRTGTMGFASFPEICTFLKENKANVIFDQEAKSPYTTVYDEWISFDNEESLAIKAGYIKNNSFGGAMIYSLNTDDYFGMCDETKFMPLTNKIKENLY